MTRHPVVSVRVLARGNLVEGESGSSDDSSGGSSGGSYDNGSNTDQLWNPAISDHQFTHYYNASDFLRSTCTAFVRTEWGPIFGSSIRAVSQTQYRRMVAMKGRERSLRPTNKWPIFSLWAKTMEKDGSRWWWMRTVDFISMRPAIIGA